MTTAIRQLEQPTALTVDELDRWLIKLAFLEPSESPIVSAYIDMQNRDGETGYAFTHLGEEVTGAAGTGIQHAGAMIQRFQRQNASRDCRSLALFARAGRRPFFIALHLGVPVVPQSSAGPVPHIYPLIEIKHRDGRFVVASCSARNLRILRVDLGTITLDVRTPSPKEAQMQMLERCAPGDPPWPLVLYGRPEHTGRVRAMLPERLLMDLAGIVSGEDQDSARLIQERTEVAARRWRGLKAIEAVEEKVVFQSRGFVRDLRSAVAVTEEGQASLAVLAEDSDGETAVVCDHCGSVFPKRASGTSCPGCGDRNGWEIDAREIVARSAIQNNVPVTVAAKSAFAVDLGSFCVVQEAGDSIPSCEWQEPGGSRTPETENVALCA